MKFHVGLFVCVLICTLVCNTKVTRGLPTRVIIIATEINIKSLRLSILSIFVGTDDADGTLKSCPLNDSGVVDSNNNKIVDDNCCEIIKNKIADRN